MRFILLILLFQFHLLYAFGQYRDSVYRVDFIKKNEIKDNRSIKFIIAPQKMAIDTFLIGKPSTFDSYAVFSVTINPFQEKYERYIKGTMSKDEFSSYVERFKVDTTMLLKDSPCENHFYVFVGLDKVNGKKAIIVDSNNNHDFSDDSIFVFNLKDYDLEAHSEQQTQLFPRFQVDVAYYNGFECFPTKTSLSLNPFDAYYNKDKYSSEDEYLLNFVILTDFYFEGNIDFDDKKVTIIGNESNTNNLISEELNRYFEFRFFEEGKTQKKYVNSYQIGDTILIAGKKISIQEVKGKTLYLKDLGNFTDGSQVGDLLPDIYAYDLENNQRIQLNPLMQDKYVFIDFWGSWCNPCIASIPKLKEFYNDEIKNRGDVMLLGVALEEQKDIGKLKDIIKENNIEWLNVWSSFSERKSLSSIHGLLGIEVFPTYIIVNKNGRIIYNSYVNSKDSAVDFFIKLINNEK